MSKKTKFRRISHYKKAERFLIKRVQVGKKPNFAIASPSIWHSRVTRYISSLNTDCCILYNRTNLDTTNTVEHVWKI